MSGTSSGSAADLPDATLVSNVAAQTISLTVPSSHIFWTGGVYVGAIMEDASSSDQAYAFQQLASSTATGFGPVLPAPTPTTTTISLTSPSQVHGSTPAAVSVTVAPAKPGTVSVVEGTTVLASAPLPASGSTVIILPATLASGQHALAVQFIPSDPTNVAASTSVPFGLTVISVAKTTKTTISLSKKRQTYKKKAAKVSVTVSGKAVGTATVFDGKKKLKTLTLKKGKASYTLSKKLKKGTHKIKVVYTPKDVEAFKKSTSKTLVLKVTK